jgi:predicted HAD superfamily Cof-like phosphohydrolase
MKTTDLVKIFHRTFGCRISERPTAPQLIDAASVHQEGRRMHALAGRCRTWAEVQRGSMDAEVWVRLNLLQEELSELALAFAARDKVAVLDALTDLQYVLDGTYVAFGFDQLKKAAFKEVHRTNMAKLDAQGRPIIAPNGRVLKPEGWEPPDLKSLLK